MKTQDTPDTSAPLSCLLLLLGNTFPSHCPAQECGCKHLEEKGKHRLVQTPTQVFLL